VAKSKHRTYPEKVKDGEVEKLRNANKRLKSENEKLKGELRTYEAAFQKNIQFLKGKTKDLSLQELLDGAKKEQDLKGIEVEKEMTFKEMTEKWRCKKCKVGVLKLIVYTRPDGPWYIRSCGNKPNCNHRTEGQPFHDGVEGVK
jgi:hypothetical protein